MDRGLKEQEKQIINLFIFLKMAKKIVKAMHKDRILGFIDRGRKHKMKVVMLNL